MFVRSLFGNREISGLTTAGSIRRRPASGRRGAEADDARAREVRLPHSSDEADEQGCASSGGAGGAKGEAKGNAERLRTRRTQCRISVSQQLDRVRQAARRGEGPFTALLHHVSEDVLLLSFFWLKRKAAIGVDGVSWVDYEEHLEANLADLHKRIHSNTYRAQPSRRQYIPKPDGQQRPLGIAALEDKIVQRALVAVLNAIYEHDFLGFSYGFRPGRGQHDALDALAVGIMHSKVNWILDADIRKFFDSVSHDWLIRFLEHRIGLRRTSG